MGIYRFGAFTLNTQTYELCRNGEAILIEPQVFSVLAHLIENRDRVVSKDELIRIVWNGRVVSDATVSSRISAARRALHDAGCGQSVIKTIPRRGFRFMVSDVVIDCDERRNIRPHEAGAYPHDHASVALIEKRFHRQSDRQRIQFCASKDGTKLAFATIGDGLPFVKTGHWLTHLEFDWTSTIWRPVLNELSRQLAVTRYDQRGNGLSDWPVVDFSLTKLVDDLEAVVDAAGLETFALYSLGAPIAVAYAVRHPRRVSRLILHGGYVQGRLVRDAAEEREQGQAMFALIRHGWGKAGSPFVKALTTMYIPGGTKEQIESLAQLQRQSTTPESAAHLRAAIDQFDFTGLLKELAVPTLVIHARNDGVQPLEEGRKLASGIKDSQFVMLDSANHIPIQNEPAWDQFFRCVTEFVRS
jgi:DNA-binding winged helix-turn-helix (wHTH) protein/pimeloyl-ACP methyl ester carboxylesterase